MLLLYGLSAYFLFDTKDFTEDSLLYPKGLVWILLIFTTLLLIQTVMKKTRLPKEKDEKVIAKFFIIFIFSLIYVFLVPSLGFVVSSMMYCPATAVTLGYKRRGAAFLISAVTVALVYVGFRMLLKVPIPTTTFFGITI